jgi:hypothetical protein
MLFIDDDYDDDSDDVDSDHILSASTVYDS